MLQKPKDPIQMKHQKPLKPIPQERNPLQHFNSITTKASQPPKSSLQSRNPKSSVKCTKNTNLGSRKPPSIVKNTSFPKPTMNKPQRSNLLPDLASGSEKSDAKLRCIKQKQVSGDSVYLDQIDNNLNVIDDKIKKPKLKNAQRLNLLSNLSSGCEKSDEIDDSLNVVSESIKKPKLKNGQRLNLLSNLRSGCEKSDDSLNVVSENITPVNKLVCGSSLGCKNYEDLNGDSGSNSKVMTPPIEPSVSPEIPFGGSSLLVSAATPSVCYGTGHVLSGVTDKRKCRSRGILTVGDGLSYSLGSGKNGNEGSWGCSFDGKENVKVEEFGSLILVPGEASVKWLLSPCDENSGSPKGESSSKLKNLGDGEGSSPSVFIGSDSDLVWDSSERVCRNLYTPTDSGKTCMSSPRRFEGFTENLSERRDGDFLSNGVVKKDKNGFRRSKFEKNSPLSIGSLSSGNVMQTPNSDYASEENKGGCWLRINEHGTRTFMPELELDDKILGRASSIVDPLGLSYQSTDLSSPSYSVDLPPPRKNFDNHVSSISVSSVDNMSQSNMRISWRDALASHSSDMEELDRCRCLSDEDIGVNELQKLGNGSACKSPECIKHEIAFPLRKKEKVSPGKPKSCAESISTDGGGLAGSVDFD